MPSEISSKCNSYGISQIIPSYSVGDYAKSYADFDLDFREADACSAYTLTTPPGTGTGTYETCFDGTKLKYACKVGYKATTYYVNGHTEVWCQ